MSDDDGGDRAVVLSAAQLAGLERALPPGPPGGELEPGDAVVATFEVDCRRLGPTFELTCDPAAVAAFRAFVDDPDVQVQAGLDEELDDALRAIVDIVGEQP